MTLEEIVQDAITELKDWLEDNPGDDPADTITEIADSSVPVYNSDLLKLAADNLWLGTDAPEIYAFDGSHTPVNAIAGNVYEHVEAKLHEAYEELEPAYEALESLKELIPHGSGINGVWSFELDTEDNIIMASNTYEAMNEVGFYCCDWPFTATYDLDLDLTDVDIEGDLESCECGYGLDDHLFQVLHLWKRNQNE
jgi:hypothetical protein